jgi:hypothetical protein
MVRQQRSRHAPAPGQRGQAIVLVAFMFTVMVAVLALVLQSGGLYWERRSLQATADAAALASAMKLDGTCSDAVAASAVNEAVRLLDLHLGDHLTPGNVPVTGDCGGSVRQYTATATFPNSVSATIHYPYKNRALEVEVLLSQANSLQFSAFLGVTSSTVPARAVAHWGGSYPGGALAAYSETTIQCIGSSDWTVYGTVYSKLAISSYPSCGIEIKSIRVAGSTYQDFGNLMILKENDQNWSPTVTLPWGDAQTVKKWLRVDGWAAAGKQCGTAVWYKDASQRSINPEPCPARAVPDNVRPLVIDPNSKRTTPYSAAPLCNRVGDHPAPTTGLVFGVNSVIYQPGCYDQIDVSAPPVAGGPTKVFLNPGFYYFNGNGLCMGSGTGAELKGDDVTLQFAGAAGFTTGSCANPTVVAQQCADPCAIGSTDGVTGSLPFLKAPYENSSWCKAGNSMYPACLKVLAYQDPSATGVFYLDSPGASGFLRGTVSWQNACTVWSNGGGVIQGQLLCNKIIVDSSGKGSAPSNAIYFHADDIPPALREPSLVE